MNTEGQAVTAAVDLLVERRQLIRLIADEVNDGAEDLVGQDVDAVYLVETRCEKRAVAANIQSMPCTLGDSLFENGSGIPSRLPSCGLRMKRRRCPHGHPIVRGRLCYRNVGYRCMTPGLWQRCPPLLKRVSLDAFPCCAPETGALRQSLFPFLCKVFQKFTWLKKSLLTRSTQYITI